MAEDPDIRPAPTLGDLVTRAWPMLVTLAVVLVAWGTAQADLKALRTDVDRLNRRDEAGASADQAMLQRLTSVEVELRSLRAAIERQWAYPAFPTERTRP